MTADQEVPVDFGVLGPLSAEVAGSPVPLQSGKTRVVLASLLLRPNRTVSVEELVDRLWDNDPPNGARNATQSYVMRLRKALGSAGSLISTQPAGYLIEAVRKAWTSAGSARRSPPPTRPRPVAARGSRRRNSATHWPCGAARRCPTCLPNCCTSRRCSGWPRNG